MAREPPVSPAGVRSVSPMIDLNAVGIDAELVRDQLLVGGDETGAVFLVAHDEFDPFVLKLDRSGLGKAAAAALGIGRHADAPKLVIALALRAPLGKDDQSAAAMQRSITFSNSPESSTSLVTDV